MWEAISGELVARSIGVATALGRRIRRILPFSQKRKASWNLEEQLRAIEWALGLNEMQFFAHVFTLYPKLERYGMTMPDTEPSDTGFEEYDAAWYPYHSMMLSVLRDRVTEGTFDLDQWNTMVEANDRNRRLVLETLRSASVS